MTAVAAVSSTRASVDWGRALTRERPGEQSRLVPVDAAKAVIAEVEADMSRMPSEEDAHKMLRRLLGAYRTGQVQDPEVYADLLREELASAPRWVGAKAVTEITRRLKWPPTRAELVEAIEAAKVERRLLAMRAQQHLDEHARRAAAAEERRALERDRADPQMQAKVAAVVSGFMSAMGGGVA